MLISCKLPTLTIAHWNWFIDQCGCNNNLHKWCLTLSGQIKLFQTYKRRHCNACLWPRHTTLTTNPVPSASLLFKVKAKKLWEKDCLTTVIKSFTMLWWKKLGQKISKWQFSLYLPVRSPLLFPLQQTWTKQICDGGLKTSFYVFISKEKKGQRDKEFCVWF